MSQACREGTDKAIGVYIVRGLFDLVARGAFETDIGLDISGEEEDVLLHHTDAAAQSLDIPLANIDPIDEDLPALDFVKTADQVDDRALASAGRPHQCDALAGLGFEGGIPQDPIFPCVGKPHPAEFNLAQHALLPVRAAFGLWLGVEQFEDPLRGGHRHLQCRVELADIADRHEEAGHILQHRHQHAPLDLRAEHLAAPVPQHQRRNNNSGKLHEGKVDRMVEGALHPRIVVGVVGCGELARAAVLAAEQLHHLHPRDRLL